MKRKKDFMSLPITKMLYDHRALTTGVRDWPLLKSVVVTSFCFSNAVNTMSCYCKHSEFLKKFKTQSNKAKNHTNDDPGYNELRWCLNETV